MYVAGACQHQLKKEFRQIATVNVCPGLFISDRSTLLEDMTLVEDLTDGSLSYTDDRNFGGQRIPSRIIARLGRVAFKVYADFIAAGLFDSSQTGPCIPLMTVIAEKKFDNAGFKFQCDLVLESCVCSDVSSQRLKRRAFVYFFRTFVKVFCSTLNDRLSVLRDTLVKADANSKHSRKLTKLTQNKKLWVQTAYH